MAQLRQGHEEFVRRDAAVVVIGPDGPAAFASYWREHDLPFVGLPDPKHSVLKLYGQEVNLFKLGRMPAQMIVDRQGVLRYVHYGHDLADIPANEELFGILDGLNAEQPEPAAQM
jgi:peroxiredoxin Q/BCP